MQYLLSEAVILSALGCALGALVLFNIPAVLAWWMGEAIPVDVQEAMRAETAYTAQKTL